MLEIAERWGFKPREMMEMDAAEFRVLVEYQTRRPSGMYDDIRAYRQIQMTSMAEKLPKMEELFPGLISIVRETKQSASARVAEINKDPFIQFIRKKAADSGEEILKMDNT